ncbi:MAG: YceI family protein [Chloroflexi bacterium]|uniref:YceI family protein n=1 Tax=Candidatus Chlorohelix allophototropha TaxID=3003348 RepID=A0A8T7M0W6_9CHLR|nr:YceI family protein [Chloroflexota bacterium]WJW67443.1 YceI family protein [Chloroflexota bacterium L227-S17]
MIWQIDGEKSAVGFGVKHMMFSTVKGYFQKLEGKIDWDDENPGNSEIEAIIETGSVHTDDTNRDKHLRKDFFDIKNYPYMTFKSTKIKPIGENKYHLIGNLTIKKVTREVNFEVVYSGRAGTPFAGDFSNFRATTQINRKDFGLVWSAAIEASGVMVGDQIKIELLISMAKEYSEFAAA